MNFLHFPVRSIKEIKANQIKSIRRVITITFILVYGSDGTGKSVQCKNVAEAMEDAEHWSFATKNRKLYEQSEIQSVELLRFNPDNTVNPYQTMDVFRDKVTVTVKESNLKFLVIDEITLLRKYAQPVIIEEVNRARRSLREPKPPITKIGENNYAAWEQVNKLVYGRLELLANWSEITGAIVIAITSIVEQRRMIVDAESGESKSVGTGEMIVDAKENVRKLADIRVKLEKDGRNGKGYYAVFEKTQDWMLPGKDGKDAVKVGKDGLLTELIARGVIEI